MNILIIEDDTLLAEFTKRSLRAQNHHVSVVHDGSSSFKRAQSGAYDAIILDILLPGKDGLSICNELRRMKVETPIMILSSKTSEESRITGLDAGADDYMVKPFSRNELSARLRAITRRPSTVVQSNLQVGDLILDPVTRRVTRAGTVIGLRPKEFELLEYMMRNQGIALQKHVLLSKVWHIYSKAASNRLEVYIRQLRQKIDQPYESKLIHTVRGVGYTLDVKPDQ